MSQISFGLPEFNILKAGGEAGSGIDGVSDMGSRMYRLPFASTENRAYPASRVRSRVFEYCVIHTGDTRLPQSHLSLTSVSPHLSMLFFGFTHWLLPLEPTKFVRIQHPQLRDVDSR
jgi:hypothetical protein